MAKRKDLTDNVYGELTVLGYSHNDPVNRAPMWLCKCSCGVKKVIFGYALTRGNYKSCGCKHAEKLYAGAQKYIEQDSVDGTRKSALTAKLHAGNKSGVKGVRYNEQRNKWTAHIGFKNKQISLGYFDEKEDAIAARKAGEEKYHNPILAESKKSSGRIDITGEKYGRLTVLKEVEQIGKNRRWLCKCECGNETTVVMTYLRSGNTKSCGCLHKEKVSESLTSDLTGFKFGKLTVIKRASNRPNSRSAYWECRCECGNSKIASNPNLKSGGTNSCGLCKNITDTSK